MSVFVSILFFTQKGMHKQNKNGKPDFPRSSKLANIDCPCRKGHPVYRSSVFDMCISIFAIYCISMYKYTTHVNFKHNAFVKNGAVVHLRICWGVFLLVIFFGGDEGG